MTIAIILGVWLLGAVLGFWLTQRWWRHSFDLDLEDALFFGSICLLTGPISIFGAAIVWGLTAVERSHRSPLLRRYEQ